MSGIVGLVEEAECMVGANPRVVELGRPRGLVSERSRDRVGTTSPIYQHLPEGRLKGLNPESDPGPYLGRRLDLTRFCNIIWWYK